MDNGSESNNLTSPTVNLKSRDQLRRIETGKLNNSQNGNVNGNGSSSAHFASLGDMDGERRPLLGHLSGSTLHTEPGFWRHLLINTESTPGTNSPNPFVRWPALVWNVTKVTLFSSWINLLLVFVPLGIIAGEQEWSAPWVFSLNFFAIIPLAAVLSFATEEIAHRLGETLGGLVNATFGNAVELIVSIVALRAGEIEIVQSSMIGSILSNLLLVLGMCFFLGGLFEPEAQPSQDNNEDEHEPLLGPWSAAIVLVVVTLVISVCADYMVDSIDALVATGNISKTFIGLILIPIVGNAAEHVTACVVAVKDKMDLAMAVAIGSSIQIALLVTPALVMLGWAIGQEMTLHFETFETIAFALSVLVVTYTVQDGKSNYLEGAMLLGLYMIIALAFWASPTDALGKV
ncbi:Sodium/calcium exchanger protein-domain-containing protein [Chaetomium sp. MPI-CAGE-AT-0009]|nr:Sodium/calcium exchanger protein-domain-containing protein [Chaetomium sp. MPI-CAGE-AT-0009]